MKILWIAAALTTIVVASLVPGPYAPVTKAASGGVLLESARLDPKSIAALHRACGNCHSNATRWPWYSRVAPVSWLLRKDVHDGLAFLNLSRWPEYGATGQGQLLSIAAEDIRSRTMPPQRYLLLHSEAKLSDQDRLELIAALQREASRVTQPVPTTP